MENKKKGNLNWNSCLIQDGSLITFEPTDPDKHHVQNVFWEGLTSQRHNAFQLWPTLLEHFLMGRANVKFAVVILLLLTTKTYSTSKTSL